MLSLPHNTFVYSLRMENDSLDMTVEPAAQEIQMPTPDQLGISVVAGSAPPHVTVGDTFDFPITVSWSVNGSALLVVPTNSATAKGLEQIGVSQESARMVKDGKEMASITFTYKIVAQDTGNLNIPVLKYEIPTQMGTPLTLRTESTPVRVDEVYNTASVFVGIAVAAFVISAGLWRMKRRAVSRSALAAMKASEKALQNKMMVMKQRASSADSRAWLLDLESICKEYAAERFMLDAEKVDLKTLVKNGDLAPEDSWNSLLEVFADARYSGARRDGFENRETWKAAMKLMGIEEE